MPGETIVADLGVYNRRLFLFYAANGGTGMDLNISGKTALVTGASSGIGRGIAVALGGAIPLLLRRLNVDPAAAAAPMLTTVVDVCGFFLILSLATTFLL